MSIKVSDFSSSELLDQLNSKLASDSGFKEFAIKTINAKVVFNIKNKKKQQQAFLLDFKESGKISLIGQSEVKKSDAQIITTDVNLKKLITNKASAQSLFMSGKLKIRGNVTKAANIEKVFKNDKAKL